MFYKTSEAGTFHKDNRIENQDVLFCTGKEAVSVITLADGVSACSRSRDGAEIVSQAISNMFIDNSEFFLKCTNKKRAELTITQMQYLLKQKSKYTSYEFEDYSSTVASVLYDSGKKKLMFFSLGDSLILTVKDKKINILCPPSDSADGCVVTTSPCAKQTARTDVEDIDDFDSVIIFSDGAWQELFDKGRMKNEISEMLKYGRLNQLKKYLNKQSCKDDYSFIAFKNVKYRRMPS